MQFYKALTLAALAAIATANTVDMVSQDNKSRQVHFVPQEGSPEIPSMTLSGGETKTATFPDGWIGNWYCVIDGEEDTGNGMLGEVRWNGDSGLTYFDVSAIVNPDDHHNVKELYPKSSKEPLSGCQTFPCSNAYNEPDDIQTKSTPETELECLIGDLSTSKRRYARNVFAG